MDSESVFVLCVCIFATMFISIWLSPAFEKENRTTGRVIFCSVCMLDCILVMGAAVYNCIFASNSQSSPRYKPIEETIGSKGSLVCGLLLFALSQVAYQVVKYTMKKKGTWAPEQWFKR